MWTLFFFVVLDFSRGPFKFSCSDSKIWEFHLFICCMSGPGLVPVLCLYVLCLVFVCVFDVAKFSISCHHIEPNIGVWYLISNWWLDHLLDWDLSSCLWPKVGTFLSVGGVLPRSHVSSQICHIVSLGKMSVVMCHFCSTTTWHFSIPSIYLSDLHAH